tara:strand:- start:1152 stop:1475 length:324 start_codon:yes stop_codon:yes gene_type:complete
MNKQISKFEFNQNDYLEGTILLREYEYKGYFIREFEQKPCDRWIKAMRSEDGYDHLVGDERGEGGYEILDHTGEILEQDFYCMGDSATCNAEVEVDFMLMDENGVSK